MTIYTKLFTPSGAGAAGSVDWAPLWQPAAGNRLVRPAPDCVSLANRREARARNAGYPSSRL